MKKSILGLCVCALLILSGCNFDKNRNTTKDIIPPLDYKFTGEGNLVIDNEEIKFSNTIIIPESSITCNQKYIIKDFYFGVFSVSGRQVKLPSFEIGAYEVTQKLYKTIMDGLDYVNSEPSICISNNASDEYLANNDGEKVYRPVDNVSWYDAVYFCNVLSQRLGLEPYYSIENIKRNDANFIILADVKISDAENAKYGYRLPYEAEWEFVARGCRPDTNNNSTWMNLYAGKHSDLATVNNPDAASVAWYYNNAGNASHRVGLKDPISDDLKIYDMSGNVGEWCNDWYGTITQTTGIEGADPCTTPWGKVARGGCWYNTAVSCSVAYRSSYTIRSSGSTVGLRIARTVKPDNE